MKILNYKTRELEERESSLLKTPISNFKEASQLIPKSLIHIAQWVRDVDHEPQYESMKMLVSTFENKVYEAIQNTFKTAYWDTHCEPDSTKHDLITNEPLGTSFNEMLEWLDAYDGWRIEEPDWNSEEMKVDGFVKHIDFDFKVLRRYVVKSDILLQEQIDELNGLLSSLDYAFASDMKLTTTDQNGDTVQISTAKDKTENDHYCQMKIEIGNKISNEWTCTATGNLVVYGWLDSSAALNNKAIPSSYCVLEGKINSADESDNWEIVSVQPVIPAKNMTYVGFNIPVKQGFVIRARTGFTVGAKSGQYSNENDGYDTLSNDTANGFKCMIFSNKDYAIEIHESEES